MALVSSYLANQRFIGFVIFLWADTVQPLALHSDSFITVPPSTNNTYLGLAPVEVIARAPALPQIHVQALSERSSPRTLDSLYPDHK